MADHKAAKQCAEWLVAPSPHGDPELVTLAAAYIELRKLAKAVIREADRDTDSFIALRKVLED